MRWIIGRLNNYSSTEATVSFQCGIYPEVHSQSSEQNCSALLRMFPELGQQIGPFGLAFFPASANKSTAYPAPRLGSAGMEKAVIEPQLSCPEAI